MDTLKALEGICCGVNLQLQSFDYLESKSRRLTHVLDELLGRATRKNVSAISTGVICLQSLRSLLSCDENRFQQTSRIGVNIINKDANNNDEQVQIQIQRLYNIVARIRNLSSDVDECKEKNKATLENENDYDSQCINSIKFIIHTIIDSNSTFNRLKTEKLNSNAALEKKHSSCLNSKRKKWLESIGSDDKDDSIMEREREQLETTLCKKRKEKSSPEAALETVVILTEIFRRSSISDLKAFRQVNRKWNEIATSTLLSTKSLRIVLDEISLKISKEALSYKIKNKSHYIGTLQDLCKLMENSSKFPCQSLVIDGGKPANDDGVKQLFSLHGQYLRELTLADKTAMSIDFLVNLLNIHAPNLESLCVYSYPSFDFSDWDGSLLSLPNLKHVEFKPAFDTYDCDDMEYMEVKDFFDNLLNAAINLQSVETIDFDFLEEIMNANKLHLVQKLKYSPFKQRDEVSESETNVLIYERLVKLNVKLSSLEISWIDLEENRINSYPEKYKYTIISQITSILNSSKESIKQLKTEPLGFFPEIIIPELPNLKNISIIVRDDSTQAKNIPMFPPSFSFSEHTPSLSKINLSMKTFDSITIGTYFPELEANVNASKAMVCHSVKFLELEGVIFEGWGQASIYGIKGAKMLARMFPNTKSLKIRSDPEIQPYQLNPVLWYFCPNGLRSLEIYGLQNSECIIGKLVVDTVDPFFTGMCEEVCKVLRKKIENEDMVLPEVLEFLKQLRTHRSICHLKQLRELNIFCSNFQTDAPFASQVTGMFALGLMPQLKVTVTYNPGCIYPGVETGCLKDIDCCLKPIASYVRSVCSHQPH